MLSTVTPRADATTGTAVLRIVVSSDSMKNATATSHGSSRLPAGVAIDPVFSSSSDLLNMRTRGEHSRVCRSIQQTLFPTDSDASRSATFHFRGGFFLQESVNNRYSR